MNIFTVMVAVIVSQLIVVHSIDFVEQVYNWKTVEYENLPESVNSYVGPYRYYIPENNNIASLGYHPASALMIVVMPRLRPGVPTGLGAFCVSDYQSGSSPKIWGFPNYYINALRASDFEDEGSSRKYIKKPNKHNTGQNFQTHNYFSEYHHYNYHGNHHYVHQVPLYMKPSEKPVKQPSDLQNDQRIIALFHITIDEKCNRVFFVDFGQVQYYQNTTYVMQKPALWVFALPDNGCETRSFPLIRRVEMPDRIAVKGANGFTHVTLDYQSSQSCDDLFLYIPNAYFNYLVVYDYKRDEFWSFEHETFQPVVSESYLVFDKTFNYQMLMGIYSLSLGYPDKYGDQTAYYTNIAGTAQYAVSTAVLKNRRKSPANFNQDDFRITGYLGCNHQNFKSVIDYTHGVMFYSEVQSNQIRCWNIKKPLNPDYIDVVYESEKFNFGLQMIIDSRGYLWFHYCSIPIIFASDMPLDLTKINARFFRVKVSDAIRGTVCEND